jgi:hypothetical protein
MTDKLTNQENGQSIQSAIDGNTVLPAVHYAPYGEWGGERVNCNRYFATDVAHTGNKDKVTCKFCQRLLHGR